jgi:transcriptional regulator with XRE-family HTH domain
VQTNELDAGDGLEAITTLEDLGGYLQKLREKRRVTQESLSTKTGAIVGRKIARSRISEIENAKRDRVTEQELRVYMRGLKFTPRHIAQVVKVFTQCTATPVRESPGGPDAASFSALDAYPAGLGGAKGDLAPLEEESEDPAVAGHEGEGRDHRWRVDTCINPVATSLPQSPRRRWQGRHIALGAATALIVVALVGLGIEFFLRGESRDRSMSPGSPATLLAPSSIPLISKDVSDIIKKDVTFPDGAPVRVNQRFTEPPAIRDWLAGRGDAAGRDATQQLLEVVPVAPCGNKLAGQRRPGTTPQCRSSNVGPGAPDVRGHGSVIDRSRTGTGMPWLGTPHGRFKIIR